VWLGLSTHYFSSYIERIHNKGSGGTNNFHFGGARDVRSPSGVESRGKAPVEGLKKKVSQKLKQFADIIYRF